MAALSFHRSHNTESNGVNCMRRHAPQEGPPSSRNAMIKHMHMYTTDTTRGGSLLLLHKSKRLSRTHLKTLQEPRNSHSSSFSVCQSGSNTSQVPMVTVLTCTVQALLVIKIQQRCDFLIAFALKGACQKTMANLPSHYASNWDSTSVSHAKTNPSMQGMTVAFLKTSFNS